MASAAGKLFSAISWLNPLKEVDVLSMVDRTVFGVHAVLSHAATSLGYNLAFPVHEHGVVLVTGASTVYGFKCCQLLADQGYIVVAVVTTEHQVGVFGRYNRHLHKMGRIVAIVADLTSDKDIQNCLELTESLVEPHHKQPFVAIINCQSKASVGPVEMLSIDEMLRTYQQNTMSIVRTIQAFLPLLRQDKGRIINVSSCAGVFAAAPANGSYAASKMALEAVSDALRVELYRWNISVSIIEPGHEDDAIRIKTRKAITQSQFKPKVAPSDSHLFKKTRIAGQQRRMAGSLLSQSLKSGPSSSAAQDNPQTFNLINSKRFQSDATLSNVSDDSGQGEENATMNQDPDALGTSAAKSVPINVTSYRSRHLTRHDLVSQESPVQRHKRLIASDTDALKRQDRPMYGHTFSDPSLLHSLYDPLMDSLEQIQPSSGDDEFVEMLSQSMYASSLPLTSSYIQSQQANQDNNGTFDAHSSDKLWQSWSTPTTRAILHALTSAYPQTRYLCGWDARVAATLRWVLPDRVLDWGYQLVLSMTRQEQKPSVELQSSDILPLVDA